MTELNDIEKSNQLKESYITEIETLIKICNDISLLDLIKNLLEKSV